MIITLLHKCMDILTEIFESSQVASSFKLLSLIVESKATLSDPQNEICVTVGKTTAEESSIKMTDC